MQFIKAFYYTISVALLMFSVGCKSDTKTSIDIINVRINEGPDGLFPLTSKTAVAGQISSKVYLPLADFNPETLVLEPVLLEEIPEPRIDTLGETYDMRILKDAIWSDGKPVTANDVLFTLKLIANPYSEFGSIESTVKNIVSLSSANPAGKSFKIVFNGKYHLDLEAFTNLPILPAHIFDSKNSMSNYDYSSLVEHGDSLKTTTDSTIFKTIAENALVQNKDFKNIIGCGAYSISEWMPGQRLTLIKNKNYWGDKEGKKRTELQAFPKTINYLILPEESTAMAALKAGQIDILSDVPEESVDQIKNDPNLASHYEIATPDVLQYLYIGMNNNGIILQDVNVRKALAQLVNVDQLIQSLMGGEATKVFSPILSQKPYAVNNLKPVVYNPEMSAAILDQNGYSKKGKDGIRQFVKDGKTYRMSFSLLTTGKQLGKDIAGLFSEEARKIGIEIKIEVMDFPKILERIKSGNYDMANLAVKQFPGLDDPYLAWNSANAFGKGSNYCNFSNPLVDRITESIRTVKSNKERTTLYQNFQRAIISHYPVIFLFTPKNRIIVRKDLNPVFSVKRPGYFENTMH